MMLISALIALVIVVVDAGRNLQQSGLSTGSADAFGSFGTDVDTGGYALDLTPESVANSQASFQGFDTSFILAATETNTGIQRYTSNQPDGNPLSLTTPIANFSKILKK
eukprot:TRINITY_DN86785_c0_g1_i1.p1 TRINITY_DN86785_c0_g1~~TRINITY_DN86785_c0_g1_i1.p1  ORF type:complete len:128 (+),score=13.14 TRINITY_DN86785_c0_g1_i1:58-384(+)